MRSTLFISNLKLFAVIDKERHSYLAHKSTRGMTILRAALSQDDCSSILEEKEFVEKIKAGIEIASYDDLAVLSAVYMASFSDDVEVAFTY